MFNVYIYDYCSKRGFRRTAQELLHEAELSPDIAPPIDARQGLLFEWWSVFWLLFSAKSSGTGPEEALLYTQHQVQRQTVQRMAAAAGRLPNGVGHRSTYPPNGPMSNGIGPMQASGPSAPPGGMTSTQPTGYQQISPAQRPLPQQQAQLHSHRIPNAPFQSPSIEQSPQSAPSQQQQNSQPPMGQLGGPSPHLAHMGRPGMLQGANPLSNIQNQGQNNPPTPGSGQYTQPAGPPSRTGTPGQSLQGGMLMNHSPSLPARQPSSTAIQMMPGEINLPPLPVLQQIKMELGLQDRDNNNLTPTERQRIMISFQQKQQKSGGGPSDNAVAGPSGAMMRGPSQGQRNPLPQQQQPRNSQATQLQQSQRPKRGSHSPGDEEMLTAHTDSSPPERKRLRRSPLEQNAQAMPYPQGPQQQQAGIPQPALMAGQMMGRGGGPMMGMNGGQQQSGHPSMGGPMNLGGIPVGQPMTGSMQPMGPPGAMAMQNQQMQARTQQLMAKPAGSMGGVPGNACSPPSADSFNLGGSMGLGPSSGPGFNPAVVNRMSQKTMMPPPSPAMNGGSKDHTGTPGSGIQNKNPVNMESPRNPTINPAGTSGHTPNVNGGPPTPAPPSQNQNSGGTGPNPQGPVGVPVNGPTSVASSPPATIGGPPTMNPSSFGNSNSLTTTNLDGNIFSQEFINCVADSLEFDASMLSNADFADLGQWLNPDGLDPLK